MTEASLPCVQCFLHLVSSSINISVFHSTWLDTFWTDLIFHFEFKRRERWYNILYTYSFNQVFYKFYPFLPIDLTHFMLRLLNGLKIIIDMIPLFILFSNKLLLVYKRGKSFVIVFLISSYFTGLTNWISTLSDTRILHHLGCSGTALFLLGYECVWCWWTVGTRFYLSPLELITSSSSWRGSIFSVTACFNHSSQCSFLFTQVF